ncbi:alkaline phosphatase family protein [Halorussus salilacus]|uniref:alkaline phosphatase family protein n=1 Tax=Halorussus salilacus TaxID=2953750 RepID=UPI0020A16461|nr:nucleotide pyrophosphatase/phosphodiesterase family protein [Halorussus salilacus]USZ68164.1 alkaline phosphatase family protein [Halorussus salilacus]
MLRTDLAESLRAEFGEDGSLLPDYGGYCFANVPHTVASVLGADTGRTLPDDTLAGVDTAVENVLVVLVDGFGFEQWRRVRDAHPFLSRLSETARVTPLTATYPSETAAAIHTFHTGSLPAEHGVIGWNVYEPSADQEFEALPFLTKDGEEPEGLAPEEVSAAPSLYPELEDAGVSAHHVVPFETTTEGAARYTYESLADFPERVGDALGAAHREDDRSYCYAYLHDVDQAGHESGTRSESYRETVGEVFDAVSAALSGLDAAVAEETLLVVTADHGHVNTDPERNVDLDGFEEVVAALARRDDGTPVRFSGSPRNVHLHLQEGREAETAAFLRENLDAKVFTREEVLDCELFGDAPPSETFRRRLGDVVVTHRNLGVWWGDEEPDELAYVGMHGGLHPEEMLVPFAAAKMDELVGPSDS